MKTTIGSGTGGGPEQVLLVGSVQTVTLSVEPKIECDSLIAATRVDTSVVGPDNLPVASTQSGFRPSPDTLNENTVDVSFTPQVAGSYHLVGTFSPSVGIAQLDLRAAWNRTDLPAYAVYDAATVANCQLYAVTASGTLLCTTTDTKVAAFRGGAKVDAVPGNVFAIHGNEVWVATDTNQDVVLYSDPGTGPLVLQTPSAFHVSAPINQFVPGDGDTLVMMDVGVSLLSAADGGLAQTRFRPDLIGLSAGVRDGKNVLLASANTFLLSLDGGDFESPSDPEFLVNLGYGPEGVWFVDGLRQLRLYTPDGFAPVATAAGLNIGTWLSAFTSPLYGPVPYTVDGAARTFAATWDASSKQLFLSAWSLDGTTVPAVSAGWAVLVEADASVVVKQVPPQ